MSCLIVVIGTSVCERLAWLGLFVNLLSVVLSELFLIIRQGKAELTPMRLEPGGSKMEIVDINVFWNNVFKNYDRPGHIVVRNKKKQTNVTVSLAGKSFFNTWVKIRKSNVCRFTASGTTTQETIKRKEFFLLLYIIHLEGLYGNRGEVIIPPGVVRRTNGSSAFKFSDIFRW